jgi:hypothetical protein
MCAQGSEPDAETVEPRLAEGGTPSAVMSAAAAQEGARATPTGNTTCNIRNGTTKSGNWGEERRDLATSCTDVGKDDAQTETKSTAARAGTIVTHGCPGSCGGRATNANGANRD